jgi:hypothetical protein
MLEDEYKSAHTNLKEWCGEDEKRGMEKECQREQVEEKAPNTNPDEETQQDTSDEKKSDIRSVVIQVPPKRRKISNAFTAREVVDGKFCLCCIV